MYLKINNINGTDEMLKKIEEAEQLIRKLKSIVSDLQFDGLSVDVTVTATKEHYYDGDDDIPMGCRLAYD